MASQSSKSGWLGGSPWEPKSSAVFTRPVPKKSTGLPEPVYGDAAHQRVLGLDQPLRRSASWLRATILRQRRQARRDDRGDLLPFWSYLPAPQDERLARPGHLLHDHRRRDLRLDRGTLRLQRSDLRGQGLPLDRDRRPIVRPDRRAVGVGPGLGLPGQRRGHGRGDGPLGVRVARGRDRVPELAELVGGELGLEGEDHPERRPLTGRDRGLRREDGGVRLPLLRVDGPAGLGLAVDGGAAAGKFS